MKNLNFMYLYYMILIIMLILILIIPSNFFKFHPLLMTFLLMIYTLISTLKINFNNSFSWYSYIMFLIMIGGLMILFMYFTSLANNQTFFINKPLIMNLLVKMTLLFIFFMLSNKYFDFLTLLMNNSHSEIYSMMLNAQNSNLIMMKNLLMDYFLNLNFYLIMYLLFTMICVSMICFKKMTPLRQNLK